MFTRRDLAKLAAGAGTAALVAPARKASAQTRPTLTIAVDSLWQNMAPINGISNVSERIFPNIYDGLIERDYISDPNGLKFNPKLATAWEQHGAVWHFNVRQGVSFHDGSPLTAEDAAFTLSPERLWGPKAFEPRGKTYTAGFKRVEATGPYTLEIETDRPDPLIPGKLTGYIGYVVPKKYYLNVGVDGFGQKPIGAGPYKVASYHSDEAMVLDAFDGYWGPPAPAQQLIWKVVPEFAARMAGLVSGEFDFIVTIPSDQEATLAAYSGIKLERKLINNYPFVAFNSRPDPVDNPLVDVNLRYAMVQALDLDAVVKALFGDKTFHPSVPFNFVEYGRYYDPTLKPALPYDPDAAKALIKKTKYNGEKLLWHEIQNPDYATAAAIMIEQWQAVGVNVEAQSLANFDLVYRRPYHLMGMALSSDFIPGDPYEPVWLDWGPSSTRSSASWKVWDPSAQFLALGNAFEQTTDFADRNRAFLALSAEWQRLTPGFFLWKNLINWAHKSSIQWVPIGANDMRMFSPYLKV